MNTPDPYTAPAAPLADPVDNSPSDYFLLRCWRGQAPLWQAFWLVLLGGYALLNVMTIGLTWGLWIVGVAAAPLVMGAMMVLIAAQMFCGAICVWRCAPNTLLTGMGVAARIVVLLAMAVLVYEILLLWAS